MAYDNETEYLKAQNKKLIEIVEHQIERLKIQTTDMETMAKEVRRLVSENILKDEKKCNFFKWLFK